MFGARSIVLVVTVLIVLLLPIGAGAEIRIRGLVADAAGLPLPDVILELRPLGDVYEDGRRVLTGRPLPAPLRRGRSNAAGRFEVVAPAIGFWQLTLDRAGHVPMVRYFTPLLEDADTGEVRLRTARTLRVVVTDDTGSPLPGTLVRGRSRAPQSWPVLAGYTWEPIGQLQATNAQGRAVLRWNVGDRLDVHVRRPGFREVFQHRVAGERLDVRLVSNPGHVVRLLDAEGRPLPNALFLRPGRPLGLTDKNGEIRVTDWDLRGEGAFLVFDTGHGLRAEKVDLRPGQDTVRLPPVPVVRGRVLEQGTGHPIAGALIWQGAGAAHTDAEGRFAWPLSATGNWVLSAASEGFAPEFVDRFRVRKSLGLEIGELAIPLGPPAVLRGLVRDDEGVPVAGARVRIRPRKKGASWIRTTTTADGRFRSNEPRLGEAHVVEVTSPDFAPAVRTVTPRAGSATLEIVLERGATVLGRLVDPGGRPVDGAVLRFERLESDGSRPSFVRRGFPDEPHATTGEDGSFRSSILGPGPYEMDVRHESFVPRENPVVRIEADAPVDLGTVVLDPAAVIEVRAKDTSGRAIEGLEVSLSSEWDAGGLHFKWYGKTDADGFLRSKKVAAGRRFDVEFHHDDYPDHRIAAVEAPTARPLDVVMRPGGRLEGRVIAADGTVLPDVEVVARITSEHQTAGSTLSQNWASSVRTNEVGRFIFKGLPASDISLHAEAPDLAPATMAFELLEDEVKDDLELVLTAGLDVTVRLVDALGDPVAGAWVEFTPEGGMSDRGHTDDAGFCRFGHRLPGPVKIKAGHEQKGWAELETVIERGASAFDLVLASRVVSGRVTTVDGRAVYDARVTMRLMPAGGRFSRSWMVPSLDGGRFAFYPESLGEYQLWAEKHGLASETFDLSVTDVPLLGLELVLHSGAAIVGRVLGVDPREMSEVTVSVGSRGGDPRRAAVDFEGRYRISGLEAGRWVVEAQMAGSPRTVRETVEIQPGEDEVVQDLDLSSDGAAVRGRVLVNGRGAGGLVVHLGSARTRTNQAGEFRLRDLQPEWTRLEVRGAWGLYRDDVELWDGREFDVEIDVRRVVGEVTSVVSGGGVAGAEVRLIRLDRGHDDNRIVESPSDASGRFELRAIAGSYRLSVSARGHSTAMLPVDLLLGRDVDGLDVTLAPSLPFVLTAFLESGEPVLEALVAAFDGEGHLMFSESARADASGRLELETLPSGSWQIVVITEETAPETITVDVPGEVSVALRPKAE